MTDLLRVIILGTGTDVGKTYVGSRLAQAWAQEIGPVLALKPIESGVEARPELAGGGTFQTVPPGTDAFSLRAAATYGGAPLYSFREPLSPHLAAAREQTVIELPEIRMWVEEQEAQLGLPAERRSNGRASVHPSRALSLVESAGGVFSPLSQDRTNFDLAKSLDPAFWILVAPDSIGVLHDLGATLRAMRGRTPDLVVLSRSREPDSSTGTNAAEIYRIIYSQLEQAAPRHRQIPVIARDADGSSLAQLVVRLGDDLA
jgi:dethiobiotin synthetase